MQESISLADDASYNNPPEASRSFQRGNMGRDYFSDKAYNGASTMPASALRVDTFLEGDTHKNNQLPKKKKKKSLAGSLKKLVGYKTSGKPKSSKTSLTTSSSYSEDETVNSHTINEESSLAMEVQRMEENIPTLQSKIAMIRSNIQSLERNLISTRNDLAKAHDHLYSATMELEDLQRSAIETDIGLSTLCQRQRRMPYPFSDVFVGSRSTRSMSCTSAEHQFFLTPTSSLIEDDDSDMCYTPRSTAYSFESLSSPADRDATELMPNDSHNNREVDVDATPLKRNSSSKKNISRNNESIDTPSTAASTESPPEDVAKGNEVSFYKHESFIRTHDLGLLTENGLLPLHDTDLGTLIDALFKRGLQSAVDESDSWTPVRETEKILNKRCKANDEVDGPIGSWSNAASGGDVLVWSAPCEFEGHGSQYPVAKARGLIPTTAISLVQLLLDSNRTKEYNKMSLGRTDEHCFSKGVDEQDKCPNTGIQGEAKIVRSKSQPPIIRRPVELRILLHARRLHAEGETPKYITIGRSVWESAEGTAESSDASATRCEMLLSANLIRELDCGNGESWCELTTITHAASPGGIPLSIGKRVGLVAAANYIKDIRAVFQ